MTAALASGAEDFLVRSPDAATLATWLAVMEARVDERAAVEKERLVLRALMDHFPGNIYFKDLESRFTRTNRAFTEYVGHEGRRATWWGRPTSTSSPPSTRSRPSRTSRR